MPSNRKARRDPIGVELDHVFIDRGGLTFDDVEALGSRLSSVRDEVCVTDVALWEDGRDIPESKQPLDAGFITLPESILSAYESDREGSELARIFRTARRLSEQVDRVVLLGIGGSYMGARALMEACCPPYYNELSRADRGGRPRLYFEGNNVDNDATQGLLAMLPRDTTSRPLDDDWAIVVVSKSGGTIETAVALRQFLALRQAASPDAAHVAERVIPVTGEGGKLSALAEALGCPDIFRVPEGVGGRFSVFSPVGLLPAAILGLDVVSLLEGARWMTDHFASTPFEHNPVLQYVAAVHAMEQLRGATIRVLNVWSKALEGVGLWYDQLLAESMGKEGQGATPLTAVNTRDLHSRAQQHQEGRPDKFHTHVVIDAPRTDPLPVGRTGYDQDELDDLAETTLPELMSAAYRGTVEAYAAAGRPGCTIRLPYIHEYTIGQLLQFWMLATVVEGRLIGINPYGQPGVEAYKRNMNRILGR